MTAPVGVRAQLGRGDVAALLEGYSTPRDLEDLRRRRAALAVHILMLAAAAAALMYLERRQWFFYDEWDFLARRGVHLGPLGLFAGHNEHWSTIPILVYRAMLHTVGLRSYAPYMALLMLVHLGLAHLLWRCMLRSGAEPWISTAVVAVFLMLGAGANNLDWAFQIGFVGSMTAGMLALLLVDRDGGLGMRDAGGVLLLVAALMCSGIGVTMTVVVAIAALLRRGVRVAALVIAVPAVTYLVWLATAGSVSTTPATHSELLSVPDYVWAGVTRSLEGATGLAGAGALLVLGLVALLVRDARAAVSRAATAYACALGAVVFYLITAVGRIHLGIEQAGASRYVYIACALMLPSIAVALSRIAGRSPVTLGVIGALATGALVHGTGLLVADARTWGAAKQGSKAVILASARALATERVIADPQIQPEPTWAPDLRLADLRRMLREGWLPALGVPDDATRLLVALRLEVSATSDPVLPLAPEPLVEPVVGTTVTRLPGGCLGVVAQGQAPQVRLLLGSPGSIQVQPASEGTIGIRYAVRGRPDVVTGSRDLPVHAGQIVHLNLAAADAEPALSLPPGVTRFCGG